MVHNSSQADILNGSSNIYTSTGTSRSNLAASSTGAVTTNNIGNYEPQPPPMRRKFLSYFTGYGSNNSRPGLTRENTSSSDLLDYYKLPDSVRGYTSMDHASSGYVKASSRRPATAPQAPSTDRSYTLAESGPASSRPATSTFAESRSLATTSEYFPNDNRRIAIIERDPSPILPTTSPNGSSPRQSPSAPVNVPSSIFARRGVDRARLAIVAPPDAAPASYAVTSSSGSSPATSYSLTKSSRSKFADKGGSNNTSPQSNGYTYSNRGTSSEQASPASSSLASSGAGATTPQSPRDVGIVGTRPTPQEARQRRGTESSESDYGDEEDALRALPVFQTPKASTYKAAYGYDPGSKEASHNLHLNLPNSVLSSSSPTSGTSPPIYTPGVGEAKAIDTRVAAPIVLDIPVGVADLWLASTTLSMEDERRGSQTLPASTSPLTSTSPVTAGTTTPSLTTASSTPTDARSASTHNTSSPPMSIYSNIPKSTYDPTQDLNTGQGLGMHKFNEIRPSRPRPEPNIPVKDSIIAPSVHYDRSEAPPKRIDVHSLPHASSVVPPRPPRADNHSKNSNSSHENSRAGTPQIGTSVKHEEQVDADDLTPIAARRMSTTAVHVNESNFLRRDGTEYPPREDSDTPSEYSSEIKVVETIVRKNNSEIPPQLQSSGSIHLREGAFPANSVFLDRLKHITEEQPTNQSNSGHQHNDLPTPTNVKRKTIGDAFPSFALADMEGSNRDAKDGEVETGNVPSSSGTDHYKIFNKRKSLHSRPGTTQSADGLDMPRPSLDIGPTPPAKDQAFGDWFAQGDLLKRKSSLPFETDDLSDLPGRVYPSSHLGHGPPPIDMDYHTPFPFRGLRASQSLIRAPKRKPSLITMAKPRSAWPPSMSFHEILAEQTALARVQGYALKLNELLSEDCGLSEWIDMIISRNRPPIMTSSGPIPVGPGNFRITSGQSIFSDATFPMRVDAYKAVDITPGAADLTTPDVAATLPYPMLARQMQKSQAPFPPPSKSSSLASVVKAGSANFFSTLGRKTSMRRAGISGTQSATEARDGPRKLVSNRTPAIRSGSISAMGISGPILPPLSPTIPGGPRAPRKNRASTLMLGSQKPTLPEIPLPEIPPTPMRGEVPNISTPASAPATIETAPQMSLTMSISLNTIPRAPGGPRPLTSGPLSAQLTRTPSFPGTSKTGDNMRSTASYRPSTAGPLSTIPYDNDAALSSQEFARNLNKLCDVIPHADRATLAGYLTRANGENMAAIGRYIEDEKRGNVVKV